MFRKTLFSVVTAMAFFAGFMTDPNTAMAQPVVRVYTPYAGVGVYRRPYYRGYYRRPYYGYGAYYRPYYRAYGPYRYWR
jgi:hypothetical protein